MLCRGAPVSSGDKRLCRDWRRRYEMHEHKVGQVMRYAATPPLAKIDDPRGAFRSTADDRDVLSQRQSERGDGRGSVSPTGPLNGSTERRIH